MSLVELMVSMSIGSVVLLGLSMLGIYTSRSFAAISNYVELDTKSRTALDIMTSIVRASDGVLTWTTNKIELSYDGKPVSFEYFPSIKTLKYTTTDSQKSLLTGCDFLRFDIFQRNAIGGTYDQYTATLLEDDAKMVQVSWICSRSLFGKLVNTESVQSAKIVIRKQ